MDFLKATGRFVVVGVLFAGSAAWGGITVDPDTEGATDVRRGTDPFISLMISNPVPDDLIAFPDNIYLGVTGDGEVRVDAGSFLSNADGILGDQAGHEGMMTVTGAGSVWSNVNELTVGRLGDDRGRGGSVGGGRISFKGGQLVFDRGSA